MQNWIQAYAITKQKLQIQNKQKKVEENIDLFINRLIGHGKL